MAKKVKPNVSSEMCTDMSPWRKYLSYMTLEDADSQSCSIQDGASVFHTWKIISVRRFKVRRSCPKLLGNDVRFRKLLILRKKIMASCSHFHKEQKEYLWTKLQGHQHHLIMSTLVG